MKRFAERPRRGFMVLGLGLVGAVLAYCCVYLAGTAGPRAWMRSDQPELAWLKAEFKLSDSEFERIASLHAAYLPQCFEHCRRIEELNEKFTAAVRLASDVTADIEKLLEARAQLRADCHTAMLRHFFAVSRTMPPDQGRRYLEWVQVRTGLHEAPMPGHGQDLESDGH